VSEPLSLRRSGTARGGGRTQGDREERSAGGRNLDIGGGVVEGGTLEIISDGGGSFLRAEIRFTHYARRSGCASGL
jgi:hypothetical protein